MARARIAAGNAAAVDEHLTDPLDAPGEQAGQLVATGAGQPGDADDLAGVHVEAERGQLGAADGPDRQHRLDIAPRRREPGVRRRLGDQLAPEHQVGEALVGELGHRCRRHPPPVAEHRHTVGDGQAPRRGSAR